ncbi:MAG: FG-GAP-like repeat-containing protein [Acidobacteriota bacterium]
MQSLHNQVRPAVTSGQAQLISAMPLGQPMHVSIVLPLRNEAALDSLIARLYDPSSPDFHHFLTVDQFTQQFGPTAQDYQAVVAFAQANGLTVSGTAANHLVVPLSGTVDQIETAFNVRMNVYQHPTEDRTFYSPDREPSLNLSVPVAAISGLDNYALPQPMVIPPSANQPMIANVTGSGPGGSYLGSDMRAAYYGGTTLDGNGQAVGLFEFDGYNLSDVNSTFSNAGQTYNVPINNVLLDGATGAPTAGNTNAEGEVVLDIAQAIGMAPGLSQVRVYIGTNAVDILNSMASENIAKQISCSWSWSPANPASADPIFKEFAAQGQSFFVASGDAGAFDLAISPYFYPQEDAYTTAVGGTHLTTTAAGGAWSAETAWNSTPYGSGGGVSPDNIAIPSWQSGLASTANGGSSTLRNVPDVAMEGDFDNYNCAMGTCNGGWAGTSFAAPRWAGFMALVNEQAVEAGNAPLGGIGFLNPSLYTLAEGTPYATDMHDVTSGNNDTDNQPVFYSAVAGYDLVTGWGSPAGQHLIDDLAGPQVPGFWLIGSPATVNVNQGASGSTTVTVSDAGGFNGNVTLAVTSTLPTGVTASWGTNPTTGTSVLTLTADATAPVSTTPVTITGTSGTLQSTTTVTVAVHAPTFNLSASPSALGINQSASGTSTVTVTPLYGFTGSVNLSISGLPTGVTAAFSPASTTGTSTLTLTVGSNATGGTSTLTITGTSGSITKTTNLSLTIHAPSFQLTTFGILNVGQGTTTSTPIFVYPQYGFNGSVNLSVTGLPTGMTASFAPNPTNSGTNQSQLTLTMSSSVATGTYPLAITGTSGSITQTATLTVNVYKPTFTIVATPSLDLGQGSTQSTYFTVSPQYGFTGNVTFSITGLPAGVTALWSPNPTTGYTTLTLGASSSAAPGSTTLTIQGVSGSTTASKTLTLTVHTPSFTLYGGGSVSMGQGTTSSTFVSIWPQYGFAGNVSLSAAGLPSGVTAAFSPNPTTGSSTITFTASAAAAIGTKTVTITGTSGSQTATTTVPLSVYAPTFTVSSPYSMDIGQGTSGTGYVWVYPQYGFTGSVTLSASGLPSGVTAAFATNPTTGSSMLTLTASAAAAVGQSTVTITGTSGSQTATSTFVLGVHVPTFTLSTYGSISLGQGSSATSYVGVSGQYGFAGNVALSVSGLPTDVTASFTPNPTTGSSTLTLTATGAAPVGQYTVTVTGTSGSQTATSTIALAIYAPTFTLYGGSYVTVGVGTSATSTVYVNAQYGFTGSVSLSVSGLPSGVTASFSPTSTTNYSTITITTSNSATPGQYTFTVTGTSGAETATLSFNLVINGPSFYLGSSNSYFTVNPGATAQSTVTITPQYGFSGSVNLSLSGLPAGVTAAFSPNPTTSSSTLTLTASDTAPAVSQTPITLTATSGTMKQTESLLLTVTTPGFTVVSAPGEINLTPGGSGSSTVIVVPANGFSGNVSLAATGLPSGVTASFSPNPTGTGQSLLTLTASSTAAQASTPFTITATAGSASAATSEVVTVGSASTTTATTLQISSGGKAATSVAAGSVVSLTASVAAGSTTLTTGTVSFCTAGATGCDPTHLVGTAQLTSAGIATLHFVPGMGVHSYKAVFAGVGNNTTSASAAATLTVTATQPTTTTIAQSGSAGNYTLTATVAGQGAVAPSGSVSFIDTSNNNSVLATAALANAKATISWANPQSPTVSNYAVVLGAGDFNGDGIRDLAVVSSVNANGTVTVLLGNGNGTFTAAAASPQTGTFPTAIAVGDFNGDGKDDVAVSNSQDDTVTILIGNGDGTFTAAPIALTGSQPSAMVAGDFNRDGKLDLAILNAGNGTITVELGNGDGSFTPSPLSPIAGSIVRGLVMGDFNGDGVLDLATVNYGNNAVTILLGNGDGSFTAGDALTLPQGTYPGTLALADFNQDGKLDLAVSTQTSSLDIFLGNGDGTFTETTANPTGITGPSAISVADINGDGNPDLIEIGSYNSAAVILPGNGDGTFGTASTLSVANYPAAVTVGDFDGNGTADLAVLNSSAVAIFTSQLAQTITANATGVSPAGTGTHNVEASYPGDSGYTSSTSSTTGLTAQLVTPAVTVTPSASSITTAQALTVSVTVAGSSADPTATGSVALTSGSYTSAAAALTSGGASFNVPAGSLATGNDTLTVTYTPDSAGAATYNPASGAAPVTVTAPAKVTPTVTVTPSASSITTAQPLTVTVAVAGSAGNPTPTGTVTLTSGSYTSPAATLSGGTATLNLAAGALATGADVLTATYTPDAASASTYNTATGTNSVTVTTPAKTTPTVSVTPSAASITTAQPLTVTVAVSGGSGNPAPTGFVVLSSGGFTSSAATLSSGAATINLAAGVLAAGTDALTATYSPDASSSATYNAATGTGSVSVAKLTPTVSVTPSAASITAAQALTVTVAVGGGTGNPLPTGSVVLSSGSFTSAAATLTSGSATLNVGAGLLALGADALMVTYTPDGASAATYSAASGVGAVNVTPAIGSTTPTVTVTASAATITDKQSVTVTVTVAGTGGQPAPTGNISLSSGSYNAQQPLSSGTASFNLAAGTLGSGADTLTAAYSGDPTYAAASATTTVTVAPVLIAVPTLSSVAPGSNATGNVTLTAGSTYSGTMSVSCTLTASPSGAQSVPSCSLNPASVVLASGGTGTTALTISTTAASTASLAPPAQMRLWRVGGAGSLLALVMMFGIPAKRRRWASMLVLLLFVAIAGAMGCGGGSGSSSQQPPPQTTPATTAGNYTFVVKATDSGANVTASANVTLTVQ